MRASKFTGKTLRANVKSVILAVFGATCFGASLGIDLILPEPLSHDEETYASPPETGGRRSYGGMTEESAPKPEVSPPPVWLSEWTTFTLNVLGSLALIGSFVSFVVRGIRRRSFFLG